jgi:hypothetical protein
LPLPFASSYHLIAVLIAKDGDLPTEDFHLISSCPCWAYTSLLNIITAKQRPPLDAQKTRAIYKKR